MHLAVSPNDRLFYYTMVSGVPRVPRVLEIEALIEKNDKKYHAVAGSSEVVQQASGFEQFRRRIGQVVFTSEFWFSLLSLGGKLWGKF